MSETSGTTMRTNGVLSSEGETSQTQKINGMAEIIASLYTVPQVRLLSLTSQLVLRFFGLDCLITFRENERP
jgi:hypothetical protein